MDNQEKYKEDLLTHYINSERIEKAPEGFTTKVMTRIQVEIVPVNRLRAMLTRSRVPLISAAVTIILMLIAILVPESKSESLAFPALDVIKNLKISFPEINLDSIFRLNLPATLIYVFVGILILSLFDRALYRVFHREKQE